MTLPALGSGAPALPAPAFDVEDGLRQVERALDEAMRSDDPLLTRMVRELQEAGGKRMRPRIALLAYAACGGAPGPQIVAAAAASELIHTASLVHDDIIDQSPLRRGRPTIHVTYGVPHALVAGDFLFTRGFALAGQLPPEVVAVNAEACIHLAEGEVMEQRLLADEVDEDAYLRIVTKKTAEPIRACARAGATLARASPSTIEAFGRYGRDLGIAFQIADDILDVVGDPREMGKVQGQDAKTGVLTLPLGVGGASTTLRDALRRLDPGELRARLEADGVIDRARAAARKYAERAKGHLADVPSSPHKDALLALADDAVRRRR